MRVFLGTLLHQEGYRTDAWERGEDAHEFIRRVQPDLVILDLWLEHRDTSSMVLGMLAVDPATQHIPVIVCTAFRQLLPNHVAHITAQEYVVLRSPLTSRSSSATSSTCYPSTPRSVASDHVGTCSSS